MLGQHFLANILRGCITMIASIRNIHTKMPIILSTEKKNSKQSKAVTTNNVKIKRKKKRM